MLKGFLEGWDKRESLKENTDNSVDNKEFIFYLDYLYKGALCCWLIVRQSASDSPYFSVMTNFGECIAKDICTSQFVTIINDLKQNKYVS